MKKYLIAIGLMFYALVGYSQADSVNLAGLPIDNTVSDSARFWYWEVEPDGDTVDYNVLGQYLQILQRNSFNIYPRSNSMNLVLGNASWSGKNARKLYVAGRGEFTSDLYLGSYLRFGNNYISGSGNDLIFYDVTSGVQKLSDLIGGGTSSTIGSGLSTVAGTTKIGGTLDQNTIFELGGNLFHVTQTGLYSDYLYINPYASTVLGNPYTVTVQSATIDIYASAAFRLRELSNINIFSDLNTVPYGLTYDAWSTYWTNIKNDTIDAALVSYGMLKSYSGGGGLSGTEDSSSVAESSEKYLVVYDSTKAYYDFWELSEETVEEKEHYAEVAITAANINDGDTIELVPAPGTGYSIFPTKILIYLNGNTAVTGSDNSNIMTGTDVMQALTVANIGLNQTHQTYTYNSVYTAHGLGNTSPENKAINLAFDADYTGTNRAGWIKVWYYKIEH
jgi:hypothetical protein